MQVLPDVRVIRARRAGGQDVHGDIVRETSHAPLIPVSAGDLERHGCHLPGLPRNPERTVDPAHLQDVDGTCAQFNCPPYRDTVHQAAIQKVLAVDPHRGSRPGTAQDASTASMSGPSENQ